VLPLPELRSRFPSEITSQSLFVSFFLRLGVYQEESSRGQSRFNGDSRFRVFGRFGPNTRWPILLLPFLGKDGGGKYLK